MTQLKLLPTMFSYAGTFSIAALGVGVWLRKMTHLQLGQVLGLSLAAGMLANLLFYAIRSVQFSKNSPPLNTKVIKQNPSDSSQKNKTHFVSAPLLTAEPKNDPINNHAKKETKEDAQNNQKIDDRSISDFLFQEMTHLDSDIGFEIANQPDLSKKTDESHSETFTEQDDLQQSSQENPLRTSTTLLQPSLELIAKEKEIPNTSGTIFPTDLCVNLSTRDHCFDGFTQLAQFKTGDFFYVEKGKLKVSHTTQGILNFKFLRSGLKTYTNAFTNNQADWQSVVKAIQVLDKEANEIIPQLKNGNCLDNLSLKMQSAIKTINQLILQYSTENKNDAVEQFKNLKISLIQTSIFLNEILKKKNKDLYIYDFVDSFLHPYITGQIDSSNDKKDRKPMLELLLDSLSPIDQIEQKQIEDIALKTYFEKAVLGLYVNRKKDDKSDIKNQDEIDLMVKILEKNKKNIQELRNQDQNKIDFFALQEAQEEIDLLALAIKEAQEEINLLVTALIEALPKDFPNMQLSDEEVKIKALDMFKVVQMERKKLTIGARRSMQSHLTPKYREKIIENLKKSKNLFV